MLIGYFNEMPYSSLPQEAVGPHEDDHPARKPGKTVVLLSNKYFNAAEGSRLYHERLSHMVLCEKLGFDLICINEHHNAVFCTSSRINLMSMAAATMTSNIRIMQIGNPLSLWDNPIWLAEELAMLDMVSKGRLITGFVRGSGQEYFASNGNPAYSRDRFDEAHDLLLKIWTEPGPFSWFGEHREFRTVNPWALPLQKPHPRIVLPGHLSRHGLNFAARHGYPYIMTNTPIEQSLKAWDLYDSVARDSGYEPGPQHRGHVLRVFCADTEEEARRGAEEFYWESGFLGVDMYHATPAGFSPWDDRKGRQEKAANVRSLESQVATGTMLYGTPDRLIEQIDNFVRTVRPGILIFETNEGRVSYDTATHCLELLGEHVLPAVRGMAKEYDLVDPYEIDAPLSVTHGPPRIEEPHETPSQPLV